MLGHFAEKFEHKFTLSESDARSIYEAVIEPQTGVSFDRMQRNLHFAEVHHLRCKPPVSMILPPFDKRFG